MITDYFEDEIAIITKTTDEWGVTTESESAPVPARVEDYNQLVIDRQSKEVRGEMLIIIAPDIQIKNEDFILVKKRDGEEYPLKTKRFIIKKMGFCGGFSLTHREIII